MFVYQPTFSTLQVKKDKGIDYAISWKSKGIYGSCLFSQDTLFLFSSLFEYKIGI